MKNSGRSQDSQTRHAKRLASARVWFSYPHNCTLANRAVFHSVCQVWLSRGPTEFSLLRMTVKLAYWKVKDNELFFKTYQYFHQSMESESMSHIFGRKQHFALPQTVRLSRRAPRRHFFLLRPDLDHCRLPREVKRITNAVLAHALVSGSSCFTDGSHAVWVILWKGRS